jgi:hypothetical protein
MSFLCASRNGQFDDFFLIPRASSSTSNDSNFSCYQNFRFNKSTYLDANKIGLISTLYSSMFRISLILIYLPFLCLFYCQASIQKGIYKLPDLVIETNSTYLLRGVTTKLECQIGSTEWGSIILDRIYWMKNGVAISELDNEADEIVDIKGV